MYEEFEEFIKVSAREAGEIIKEKFHHAKVTFKNNNLMDKVTDADIEANELLNKKINNAYPDHGIISEELLDEKKDAEFVWVIDPLDGTGNYSRDIPIFCVMISLLHKKDTVLGVIYDPIHDEMFFAKKGSGAFLNDIKISTSLQKNINLSIGFIPCMYSKKATDIYEKFLNLPGYIEKYKFATYRSAGIESAYVAAGRRDWIILSDAHIWDYSAPSLILKESGCRVSDFIGNEWVIESKELIAANPSLHKELLDVISK